MQKGRVYYSILHVMVGTAIAALCFNTLVNESPWWRATLMTFTLGAVMNSLICTAICRGSKQAFSIGFSISSFFYLISLYTLAGVETLPMLLTQLAYEHVVDYAASPISESHFYMVAIVVWGLVCAYCGGWFGKFLFARRQSSAHAMIAANA